MNIINGIIKAFDRVNRDLIIVKLEVYGVGKNSLTVIQNYLSQRQQKVKLGLSIREWLEIILGVLKGSILGSILLNVFFNDLMFL